MGGIVSFEVSSDPIPDPIGDISSFLFDQTLRISPGSAFNSALMFHAGYTGASALSSILRIGPLESRGIMSRAVAGRPVLTLANLARVSPLLVPVGLAAANVAVIESAPAEQQPGLWQTFSSGLTGTVGIGLSGSSFV